MKSTHLIKQSDFDYWLNKELVKQGLGKEIEEVESGILKRESIEKLLSFRIRKNGNGFTLEKNGIPIQEIIYTN